MTDEFNDEIVTLTDEEGNNSDFYIIGAIELGENHYMALEPVENDDDDYVILRVVPSEDGDIDFETIDDDDEFESAAAAFENLFMDEIDLDEAYDDGEDNEDDDDDKDDEDK